MFKNIVFGVVFVLLVLAVIWFLFIMPRQLNALATDRSAFSPKPGVYCVQVTTKTDVAVSCLKE